LIHIRMMQPQDLEAVMRLESVTLEAPHWAPLVYQQFLVSEHQQKSICIAEEGNRLLGFAAAQIIHDVCELDSIVVDVNVRRFGVGRALLAALFDWASTRKAIRVELEVRAGNSSAIEFYLRSDFVRDGHRPSYYHHPDEDAVLMSKPLR